jgi:two-component system NarL family response regulator
VGALRILLADNHLLFRKGLARLLDAQPDFEVIGEAQDGIEAVRLAPRMRPGLVLMDSHLPICDGPEAARRIKLRLPEVLVVMLGTPADEQDLVRAVQLGVDGYLLKDIQPEQLFRQLRAIGEGVAPLSPALVAPLFRQLAALSRATRTTSDGPSLSARETDVVRLIADGQSNRAIAAQLAIAENTVKNHVRSVLRKLGARNRAQAAAMAVASGTVGPPAHDGAIPEEAED